MCLWQVAVVWHHHPSLTLQAAIAMMDWAAEAMLTHQGSQAGVRTTMTPLLVTRRAWLMPANDSEARILLCAAVRCTSNMDKSMGLLQFTLSQACLTFLPQLTRLTNHESWFPLQVTRFTLRMPSKVPH